MYSQIFAVTTIDAIYPAEDAEWPDPRASSFTFAVPDCTIPSTVAA